MWTPENRPLYDRDKLRYPSDLTDAEWQHIGPRCSDPGLDAADGAGQGDLRADLAAGVLERRRSADRGIGARAHPRLRLYGAVRGARAEGDVT